jgi:hypothetical protein
MNKVKDILVSVLVFASLVVSCSPASAFENPMSNEQPPTVVESAKSLPAEQLANLESTYGIKVSAKSLCSDGVNTTLVLQTDLDPQFWQLSENDFSPTGKTYFETSILFLENNEMYSTSSSGKRDEPVFDSQNKIVSTTQTFVFPKTPLPNSEFIAKADVTLAALPESFVPPAGISFIEPGMIKVPIEYVTSATIGECS